MLYAVLMVAFVAVLIAGSYFSKKRHKEILAAGERVMAKEPAVIELKSENMNICMNVNDKLTYTARVYCSVGINVYVIYNEEAFALDTNITYLNSREGVEMMCGGDEAEQTFCLTAMEPGNHIIVIQNDYRGSIEQDFVYKVKVS